MEDERDAAGKIRKRRFSSARIQPTRVKKVMQTDEEIGRMVASVPVAIGSAMEHFAEKLLESAAQCVQSSSARTLTPSHIRYAILKNRHFSFLEELTNEIPTPRGEDVEQAGTSKSSINTGQLSNQMANFSSAYSQNFSSFPQQTSSYDLNANTSHQRPVQCSKDQQAALISNNQNMRPGSSSEILQKSSKSSDAAFSVPTIPVQKASDAQPEKKRRGRPRKERKDKFVDTGKTAFVSPTASTSNSGQPKTPEELARLDQLLMPPPSLGRLPRRDSVNNENNTTSPRTTTSNSKTSPLTAI